MSFKPSLKVNLIGMYSDGGSDWYLHSQLFVLEYFTWIQSQFCSQFLFSMHIPFNVKKHMLQLRNVIILKIKCYKSCSLL